jgi:hypothetical protein
MTGSALVATIVLVLLGAAAILARRRLARAPAPPGLEVTDRALLSRDAGLAIVRARDELLLVGWGRDGARLVARLGRESLP